MEGERIAKAHGLVVVCSTLGFPYAAQPVPGIWHRMPWLLSVLACRAGNTFTITEGRETCGNWYWSELKVQQPLQPTTNITDAHPDVQLY